MKGWLKLHRNLIYNPIFQNENLLKVWIWCLSKATHKPRRQMVGNQFVDLLPGEFVTGRKIAGEELNMPSSTAWNRLKTLEKNESIEIKSENKFSIIKILNWESYQVDDDKLDRDIDNKEIESSLVNNNSLENNKLKINNRLTTDGQEINNSLTTVEQQLDTNKNVKNIKNIDNNSYIYSDDEKKIFENDNFKRIIKIHENNLGMINNLFLEDLKTISDIFDSSMYEAAIKRAYENNSLNFAFVKGILRNWHKDKIFNLEELEKYEKEFRDKQNKKNNKYKTSSKNNTNNYKNRFHNFKQRTEGYTESDLEAIAKRKRQEYFDKIDKKKEENNIINFKEKLG